MAQQQCPKCGESVDEAKAFCPGCGHALVEEKKRTDVSEFDQSRRTVQLGKTMYGQLLSDMGLSIPEPPKPGQQRVEAVASGVQAVAPTVPPVVQSPAALKAESPAKRSSINKWIIIAVVAAFLLFALLILAAIVIGFLYYSLSIA
jgi:hypothetical protein